MSVPLWKIKSASSSGGGSAVAVGNSVGILVEVARGTGADVSLGTGLSEGVNTCELTTIGEGWEGLQDMIPANVMRKTAHNRGKCVFMAQPLYP